VKSGGCWIRTADRYPNHGYAVKYCSSFYGLQRSCRFGSRLRRPAIYQMDYHNKKEALKEALSDLDEALTS
jgi:porphobilinogen synthase